MKRQIQSSTRLFSALALAIAAALWAGTAHAATIYWNGTDTDWTDVTDWSTASGATTPNPVAVPGSADTADFSVSTITNTAQTVNLNSSQNVTGMNFLGTNTAATTLQGGGSNQTLTLGTGGITVSSGAGAVTIGSTTSGQSVAITLTGNQTWTNNSTTNPLTIIGNVTGGTTSSGYQFVASGAGTITLSSGTGTAYASSTLGIVDGGGTTLILNNYNLTYNEGNGNGDIAIGQNTSNNTLTVTGFEKRVHQLQPFCYRWSKRH